MYHANLWTVSDGNALSASGSSTEYADDFDTMGANFANDQRTDFNPWFKNLLGWVADSQVRNVTATGTYRLNRFDNSSGTGTLALAFPRDGSRNYWVGVRRRFTTNSSMQHGAYVIWGYNSNQQSNLLDLNTPGSSVADAALAVGSTLLDTVGNVSIRNVAEGGTAPDEYLDVEVKVGLNGLPVFDTQPQSKGFAIGDTVSLTVAVSGTAPLSLQWRKNGADIAGATNATYTITNAQLGDAGVYTVRASNAIATVLSSAATLSVNAAPVIVTQPQNITTAANQSVTLSVTVTGTPAPMFQWRKAGAVISGATNSTLSFLSVASGDTGSYDVQVANSFATIISNSVSLTVNPAGTPPSNDNFANGWTLPGNSGLAVGTNVGATGESGEPAHVNTNGTATSVWFKWTPTTSGTAQIDTIGSGFDTVLSVYTGAVVGSLTKVGEDDESGGLSTSKLLMPVIGGTTYAIAVGDWSSLRQGGAIRLNYGVYVTPAITTQPVNQVASVGGTATFSVVATGTSPTFQWFRNGLALSGATNATLALANLQPVDAGSYYVSVSNLAGSVVSNTVTLSGSNPAPTITTPPANVTVTAGQAATLTVVASSSDTPTYQWRRNGFLLPGATGATLSLPSASRTDADFYDVIVASGLSAAVSPTVRLSVAPATYPGLVAPDPAWELRPESFGGLGFAIVPLTDGRAYVAGSFVSLDGTRRTSIARLNADGSLDTSFTPPEIDNLVRAVVVQSDGKIIVGGDFVRVNGLMRNRLARLNTNGSLDSSYDTGTAAGASVNALALQSDGKLVVGGNFQAYAGSNRSFMVRLNADSSLDTGFQNRGVSSTVNAIAIQSDGKILIGGAFTVGFIDAAGTTITRTRLLRLNADGTLDGYNLAPNSTVNAIVLQSDGKAVIGGAFASISGVTINGLGRINSDGTLDTGFNTNTGTGFNSTVNSLALQADGRILAGGLFTAFNGATMNRFARLNTNGTRDTGLLTLGFTSQVLSIGVLPSGKIMAGGGFSNYINTSNVSVGRVRFARMNADGSLDTAVNFAVAQPGSVDGIVPLPGGKMLVTGFFTTLRGVASSTGLARIQPDGTVDTTFNPGGVGPNSNVYAAAVQPDGKIIITGFFTTYNNTTGVNGIARLNANGTLDNSFSAGAGLGGSPGYTLAILSGGRVFVGGDFLSVNGVARSRVAVLSSTGALDASFDPGAGANSSVYTSAVQADGKIVIGGAFSTYGTAVANRITRLTATGSLDTAFAAAGAGANSSVYTVAIQSDGAVLAGGAFTTMHAANRSGIARLLSGGSIDTSFVPPSIASVFSLLPLENGKVMARGSFVLAGSGTTPGTAFLARLNSDGSRDTTFTAGGFTSSSNIPTLLAMNDGGQVFMQSSGSTGLSATSSTTVPNITTQPLAQAIPPGATLSLSVVASSDLPATYQWQFNGSPITGATNASFSLANAQTANAGSYNVVISNELGSVTSATVSVTVGETRGLLSGAVRTEGGTGSAALNGFFTVEGGSPKQFLIRAVGPTLANFGVTGVMTDPQLNIVNATTGAVVASNDDWGTAGNASSVSSVGVQVGAFALNASSKDAAVLATFSPGTYRARVTGAGNTTGTVLLEIYDADALLRMVYLGVRATAGTGAGILTEGFQINAPGSGRSYLIRALGPSLNIPGALADPQLSIYSGSTLVASNDNWSGNSTVTALTAAVGAMPLSPTSKDAALSFAPTTGGSYIVQVGSSISGATGVALLEIFESDATRAATMTPAIVSNPEAVTVTAGSAAALGVVVVGKPAPTFQWRKNGANITGATGSAFTLPVAQSTDAGTYDVVITNSAGTATSATATLAVPPPSSNSAAHSAGTGYVPGGTVTISNTFTYAGSPTSLGWSVNIPAGWSFASDSGNAGDVKPAVGQTGTLEWAWSSIPPNPAIFTYTLNVPATESVDRTLTASAIVRVSGSIDNLTVAPNPLNIPVLTNHSADTDRNFRISLLELTRVIELYNTRNGSTRTGCYLVATSATEDGFQADSTRTSGTVVTLTRYHSADSNRDGKLSLLELTRMIELYNYRSGTTRTGQYHMQAGTEDGFDPGP